MAYTKHIWQNGQSGGTPINADRLNEIEDGIEAANETAADALGTANSASAVASDAAGTADEANAKSDVAVDTATLAKQTADSATATATAAASAASVADGKAVVAQTTADGAQAAADGAQETADQALTIAQLGGGGGGAPARFIHLRVPKGEVPSDYDIAADLQVVAEETSDPDLVTNVGGSKLRFNSTGYYEFNYAARSKDKTWTGGWMAIKDPAQTTVYASQDFPSGIGTWCISGGGYFEAGQEVFIQFHPKGSGNFLNIVLDLHIVQIGALTPVVTMAKHAEATYTYAQVHGSPWNAGLVPEAATTNDLEFVTWAPGDGKFTVNETGVYSVDATIGTSPAAAIGGTLGIGTANLSSWYSITDLGSEASSGAVSLSNVYLTAGTELRFYYNCKQGVNSTPKIGRVRITQIAAQPRATENDPRGLVAWSRRAGATGTSTENVQGGGSAKPFLRLDVNLTPGRTYEVSTTAIRVGATAGLTYVQMNLGYASGANVPATVYNRTIKTSHRWNSPSDGETGAPLSFLLPVPLDADPRHSFLVDVVAIGSGQAGLRPDQQQPLDIYVRDIGALVPESSIHAGPLPDDNPAWNPVNPL